MYEKVKYDTYFKNCLIQMVEYSIFSPKGEIVNIWKWLQ